MVKATKFELQIEQLVLHGFSPQDARHIGMALERELGRLLRKEGIPSALTRGVRQANLRGADIRIAGKTRPAVLGMQIARSVYTGLTRPVRKK